jgi:hypothetical protein
MRILAVEIRGEDSATGAKVLLNNPLRSILSYEISAGKR